MRKLAIVSGVIAFAFFTNCSQIKTENNIMIDGGDGNIGLIDDPAFPRLIKIGFQKSIDNSVIIDDRYRLWM